MAKPTAATQTGPRGARGESPGNRLNQPLVLRGLKVVEPAVDASLIMGALSLKSAPPHVFLESTLIAVGEAVRYHMWLSASIAPYLEPPVLEIGSGLGGLAERLVEFVDPLLVSEPNEQLFAALAAKFASDPRVVVAPPISLPVAGSDPWNQLDPRSILMSNVLEHIDDDEAALGSLRTAFPSVARIVLVVPAHNWAYSPLDRLLGHHRRYTRASLRSTIERAGWKCASARYFNPVGALAWAISGRVFRRSAITRNQTQLVEQLNPLLSAVDRLFHGRVFGQSVIGVGMPVHADS